jgi:hypothetical protein
MELRLPNYDPTLILIVSVMTVDVRDEDGKPSLVGYAFFPLFINRFTLEQPVTHEDKKFILHNGMYQIPIYC